MFHSLKSKIIVSVVSLLILMVAFLVANVSISTMRLAETLTEERILGSGRGARAWLENLQYQTRVIAISVSSSHTVVSNLAEWNAGINIGANVAEARQEIVDYLQQLADSIGVQSFIVRDADGRIIIRLHDLNLYGDIDGGATGLASLLHGHTTTSFTTTPAIPLGLDTTVPIWYQGQIIGTLSPVFFLHTGDFTDSLAAVFGAEVTAYAGRNRVMTTLRGAFGERVLANGTPITMDGAVASIVVDGRQPHVAYMSIAGMPHYIYYIPLLGVVGNTIGVISLAFSNEPAIVAANALRRNFIISAAAGIAVIAFVIFLIVTRFLKPLGFFAKAFAAVANGDMTIKLPVNSNDEIARASLSFNQTTEEVGKMISIIKSKARALSEISNDLSINMTETAAAMNQIAANIQSVNNRVMNQSASVNQTHSTMGNVVGNINKLNGQIEFQSSHISQGSLAIGELVANTEKVAQTLFNNNVNVKALMDASEVGRSGLRDVVADIQEIARESEGLMEINEVMENIASQTNLLSMNAAIEAAHAGEVGKGFSVVADEIRKLAEDSGEQSKITGDVLKKITESISKITASTENVLGKFSAIDSNVKTVAEEEAKIRKTMEDQGEGNRQILEAVAKVDEITREVHDGAGEMLEGAKEVIHESTNLEKVTHEITLGMNEMASGAEQVNKAVHAANDLAGRTQETVSSLVQAFAQFKV